MPSRFIRDGDPTFGEEVFELTSQDFYMKKLLRYVFLPFAKLADLVLGFDVFVSYAWDDGREYAETLRDKLKADGLRVFLDDDRLHAGQHLSRGLSLALKRSSTLVLITTDASLRSKHVTGELSAFANYGRPLIPVVLHSDLSKFKPVSAAERSKISIPSNIMDLTPEQCYQTNKAVLSDRIWITEEGVGVLSNASESTGRKIKRSVGFLQRQRVRNILLTSATVVFLGLAIWAEIQRRNAVENERTATSRQLSAQSISLEDDQLDLSLLLAVSAWRVSPTTISEDALFSLLSGAPPIIRYVNKHQNMTLSVENIQQQNLLLIGDTTGEIVLLNQDGEAQFVNHLQDSGGIRSMFQLNDSQVVVGGFSGMVYIVSVPGLKIEAILPPPTQHDTAAFVGTNIRQDQIYVGYQDISRSQGGVVRWSKLKSEKWQPTLVSLIPGLLQSIAVSPTGNLIATGNDFGEIILFSTTDVEDNFSQRVIKAPSAKQPKIYIKNIRFNQGGDVIAFDNGDGSVMFLQTAEFVEGAFNSCHKHVNDVYDIVISEDDKTLMSVGSDGKLQIASIAEGCRPISSHKATIKPLMVVETLNLPGTKALSIASDGTMVFWDFEQQSPIVKSVSDSFTIPADIRFSNNDENIVVTGLSDTSGFARNFLTKNLQPVGPTAAVGSGPVTTAIFDDSGQNVSLFGFTGSTVWPDSKLAKLVPNALLEKNSVYWPGDLYSRNLNRIVLLERGGLLAVYDIQGGIKIWQVSVNELGISPRTAAISKSGKTVAVGSKDGKIQLFDGLTGTPLGEPFTEHTLEVTGLVFGNDSNTLYSGSTDTKLKIWDIKNRSSIDLDSRIGSIQRIALSDDEKKLAVATQRGNIAVWKLPEKQLLDGLETVMGNAITALRFSHSGNSLAAAAMDGTLNLIETNLKSWVDTACLIANRPLSMEERSQFNVPNQIFPCSLNDQAQFSKGSENQRLSSHGIE